MPPPNVSEMEVVPAAPRVKKTERLVSGFFAFKLFASTKSQRMRREVFLVVLAGFIFAAILTWPTLRDPAHTIPQDLGDPLMQAWLLSWPGHILTSDPTQLWNANSFYPETDTYAFTDTLIGYAPASFIGDGPAAALIRYNLIFVFAHALAFIGGYLLIRQLGSTWQGAALAGIVFAFAPWRMAHSGHLNILSTGGIALAFAALARGHGFSLKNGFQKDRIRPGWAALGWAIAAWQITLGFATGLLFCYAIAIVAIAAVIGWIITRRPRLPRPLLITNGVGIIGFLTVTLFMLSPVLRLRQVQPDAQRSLEEVKWYSPTFLSFFTAPSESAIWGDKHAQWRQELVDVPYYKGLTEIVLLPGFVVIVFAILGLFYSTWQLRTRIILSICVLVVSITAMGVELAGGQYAYKIAYQYLPGWNALRTPGRLMLWISLLLAILAAGAITRLVESARERAKKRSSGFAERARWIIGFALALPVCLAFAEGINKTPHPKAPEVVSAFRDAQGPVLVMPSSDGPDYTVMFWTIGDYKKIVNGSSAIRPYRQQDMRDAATKFPEPESVAKLRGYGVRTLIYLRDSVATEPYANVLNAKITDPTIKRTETSEAVTFILNDE